MTDFDVVVCGLGAMGSAAAYALARRGQRVLGIDRFTPGHDRGSSHGATRIIRLSYYEHPSYVPLLRRAYELWRALEEASGRTLLHMTGIAEIGPPGGPLVTGTLASSRLHGIPHDVVTAAELTRRHPAFRPPPHHVAVLQPDGGFLEAEPSVLAFLALAQRHGATIRGGETVRTVEPRDGGVRIVTERATVAARFAVMAAGPWTTSLLPDPPVPLRVTRQVMAWFEPREPALFADLPVFLVESEHGTHYGAPPFGGRGVKVAKHHHFGEFVTPDDYDTRVSSKDEQAIRAGIADALPMANGMLQDARTCLYTLSPDGDFVIDRLPAAPQVVVLSPCSGHGFKFAPAIGEIAADLVLDGGTRHDISRFALGRFR
jgi:sarcosine oxidase